MTNRKNLLSWTTWHSINIWFSKSRTKNLWHFIAEWKLPTGLLCMCVSLSEGFIIWIWEKAKPWIHHHFVMLHNFFYLHGMSLSTIKSLQKKVNMYFFSSGGYQALRLTFCLQSTVSVESAEYGCVCLCLCASMKRTCRLRFKSASSVNLASCVCALVRESEEAADRHACDYPIRSEEHTSELQSR